MAIYGGRSAARTLARNSVVGVLGLTVPADPIVQLADLSRATVLARRHVLQVERQFLKERATDSGATFRAAVKATEHRAATLAATETYHAIADERLRAATTVSSETGIALFKSWNAEGDACPRCRECDGETVAINDRFSIGSEPGMAHAQCRRWVEIHTRQGAPRPANDTRPAPVAVAPPAAEKIPRGVPASAHQDFRALLSGAHESALDFGRTGYRPPLNIYAGLSPAQINDIAAGRVAPPGASKPLPPIHIAIRPPGDLANGNTLQLIDGRHRLEAAQIAGAREMRATISVYGKRGGLKWRGERVIPTPVPDPTNLRTR